MRFVPLILAGVLANALGQVLLKRGMLDVGRFEFSASNIAPISSRIAGTPSIWLGLGCYVLSFTLWLMVLSRVDVSYAFPFMSLGYVVTTIAGHRYFDETISATRLVGIALICVGVVVLART